MQDSSNFQISLPVAYFSGRDFDSHRSLPYDVLLNNMHLLFLTLWLLQAFTYNPVEANMSPPVRISTNPDQDEDPSVVLAQDGRFYVVWASKRSSGVHLRSEERRVGKACRSGGSQ